MDEEACFDGNKIREKHRFQLWSNNELPEFPKRIVLLCIFCEKRKLYRLKKNDKQKSKQSKRA